MIRSRKLKEFRKSITPKAMRASKWTNKQQAYRKYNIGDFTYGKPIIHDFLEKLTIGRYCSIGPEVMIILGGNHRVDWASTYPFGSLFKEYAHIKKRSVSKGPITIGNDVWIGARATILSGVTIGNGAVIGAGSIVTKDVPAYAIAVGNPAKVIKKRFDDKTIARLEATKWWEKDIKQLKDVIPLLQQPDIEALLKSVSA